jgi:parallel beta-helix repeat protein
VATNGSDSNSGTSSQPWKTIGYALKQLYAGDTLYIRGASYADVPANGWSLNRSGTAAQPITITNYQSEQVIIKVNQAGSWVGEYSPFSCQGVDYVRLVGTDVSPRTLSSGLVSSKGIVIQGPDSGWTDAEGIRAWDCAYWEVSGIDFVRMGCGLFGHGFGSGHWQIHHNRIYSFCRETGMQLNGPYNTIEGNELYKVSNDDCVSYGGPSHLALLGYGNIVRNNIMDGAGSTSGDMWGILLEWDIADDNLIEGNIFKNTKNGINFAGGDNNLIRNNIFIKGSYSGNSSSIRCLGIS